MERQWGFHSEIAALLDRDWGKFASRLPSGESDYSRDLCFECAVTLTVGAAVDFQRRVLAVVESFPARLLELSEACSLEKRRLAATAALAADAGSAASKLVNLLHTDVTMCADTGVLSLRLATTIERLKEQ